MPVCYRHPRRETGVSCSNCGRPICPECMTSTPVGMRCPECSGETTRVVRGAAEAVPRLTYALIAVNVAVFAGELLAGGGATGAGGAGSLIVDAGLSRAMVAAGEWWRIFTAGFLHAGVFHLAFNMLALYVLGTLLEERLGQVRFLAIYLAALVSGALGALLVSPTGITVGASGAVFGLMGAAAVLMWRQGIPLFESGLGAWIVLNLLITFLVPRISIGGHLGGLAGGALAALLVASAPAVGLRGQRSALAAFAVAAGAFVASLAVAGGPY